MDGQQGQQTEPQTSTRSLSRPITARHRGFPFAAGLLLVGMTLAAYLPATQCGFIWDDDAYVQNNQTLRSADGLRRIWFRIGSTPQYYPLVYTTYWLEYRFWGLSPTGYHVVNILLHGVAVVLLWRVLKFVEVPGAWAAAAVFAVHPVHVESVAWITERKNVLSGVFYLGALLAYLRYALVPFSAGGDPERVGTPAHRDLGCASTFSGRRYKHGRFYAASLVLFLCALLSKTVTCTLPAVLLLVLWWKRKRIGWADVRALAPFFALGIAFGLLTIWLEKHHVGAEGEEWDLSAVDRCLVAGRVLCFYVGKLFWPARLTFIYPRWQIDAGAWQQYLYPLAAIGVVAVLWLARRRIGKGPLVAVLCFAGTLFPALGFFDVYPMRYSFVADHFQYLASAGLIALAVAAGYRMVVRVGAWRTGVAVVVLAFLLPAFGALAWHQQRAYVGLEALWRDTIRKNPHAWMAHNNLGSVLAKKGRLDEAVTRFRKALEVKPDHAGAHNGLGVVLRSQGKLVEAIHHYRRALQIAPDHADAYCNLGLAFQLQGKLDEAIRSYREGLRLDPTVVEARNNLGGALAGQSQLEEAIRHFREVLRLKPDYADAQYNLGTALRSQSRFGEALGHFREAVRLKPDWPAPLSSTAWILATHPDAGIREPNEAIRMAERAAELTRYEDAASLDALAAAYAAAGRFDQAVRTAQAALAAAAAGADELADAIRKRLDLYRQARPYREPARRHGAIRP